MIIAFCLAIPIVGLASYFVGYAHGRSFSFSHEVELVLEISRLRTLVAEVVQGERHA